MYSKFFLGILTVCFCTLFGQDEIPLIVDFSKDPFQNQFFQEKASSDIPGIPFNNAKEMVPFFQFLKKNFNIHTAIETGTFQGNTTVFFASLFENVHTIEINNQYYLEVKPKTENYKNIQLHLGNSPEILAKILPSIIQERVLFYLDAHWHDYWPLHDELKAIAKTHKNNCVIVIDDIQVPGRNDISFDSYHGQACSYEYVKDDLAQIFSDHTVHYLIPKNLPTRAKLVIIPKTWSF